MNKQDFLKTQSCVLRVNIHCDGCKSKVKKILQKIDGVYTIKIDAEQGKVTVTGNVDPSVMIKKLEKNGKHAELWGPSSKGSNQINQFMNLNNQFKNFQLDGGKMGKDNNNIMNFNNKMNPQKGGKDQQKGGGQQQQQQQQLQQQQQQQQQQHLQQLLQQMKGGALPNKDFKMPSKDQKGGKFNMDDDDDDDEFDDDEFSDEYDDDDEFDDDDDEFDDGLDDHGMFGGHGHGHHPPTKNIPIMGNGLGGKGGGGGGGDKKGKEGGEAKKGGGGMAGIFKSMLGSGNGDSKKGNEGKKDGKNGGSNKGGGDYQNLLEVIGGKNGGEGKNGKSGNGNHNNKGGSHNGGNLNNHGGGNKKGGGGGGGGSHDFDGMNHVKSGGFNNVGHPMGQAHGPMGRVMPAAAGLPATPHMMMNSGGGFPQGMGPAQGGPYGGGNPQQQQYMAMMMNQQRMNGGEGYGGHPMMYGRPPMGVGYAPHMVPPPSYHDPYTSFFSDENTNSCSIM